MLPIWLEISSVAFAVWPARLLTSCATTAKPRPASPARAASMVALSASRLVCSAIEVISFTTSPIRAPASDNSLMRWSVAAACLTASAAIPFDSWTRRVISAIELESSSEAVAAVRTCSEAVSDAPADLPESPAVVRAVSVSWPRDTLEFAGGVQHLVEDAADAGLELVDEAAQFSLALIGGGNGCRGLLLAHPAAFGRVVLEDGKGTRNLADLVHAIFAIDRDIGVAVGDRGQRGRDRGQRLGHPAHDQHGQQHHEQRRNTGGDRHVLDGMRQHGLVSAPSECRHRARPITLPAEFMIG